MPAQNSPRGLFAKERIDVGSNQVTGNSTALVLSQGVKISDAQTLTGNSTGIVHGDPEAALPSTDEGAAWTIISNSTGVALAINTTGTTWKYLNVTSVQPT